jgi:hypothetical protein
LKGSGFIELYCNRALARDPEGYEPEREQTVKLVRAFIEYGGVKHVNQGIVRAVVAIAEQQDSKLRNIALETLAELSNVFLKVFHDKQALLICLFFLQLFWMLH